MLRHISRVSTVLALVAALPAQAEILEFGPFDLGPCIDCDEILIDPKQRNQNHSAVLERGDFNGICGAGGAAILMLETLDGDPMHVNWNPAGCAVVQIWGTGGTAIYPADPDFVGIWGTGGTAIAPQEFFDSPGDTGIWGTGGTAFGFPVKIDYEVLEPEGIGRVTITIDTEDAIVTVAPGA